MNNIFNRKINRVNGHRLIFLLVIILTLVSVYLNMENNKLRLTLNNSYNRSFYELIEYLENVETLLAKSQITGQSEYSAKNLTDIWRKADLAVASLSNIPITHTTLENAEKFLNQLSDYSYSLSQKTIEDNGLTDEELSNLKNYYDKCKLLNQTLSSLNGDMSSGSISWKELTKENVDTLFAQEVSNISQDSFSKIEEDMQDYEGLIYDGPFSEHMTNPEILGLGDTKYNDEMARKVIYEYISDENISNIKYNGIIDGTIPAHSYDISLNDGSMFYIDITEKDGKVLWMSHPRLVENIKIDKETANKIALEFLKQHGFDGMKESYYTNENGILTINYAYNQDGVICYTDLIKVKIALDNGEILGIETKSYLSSHRERNIPKAKISMEEAKKKINSKLEILSEGMAVIPTDFQTELTTYEFKGKVGENNFIVYINVETGEEEEIFMILDTPGGMLAI